VNILITSAGRRVELVQEFIEKAKFLSESSKVFTTDFNPDLSAACQVADRSIKSPKVTDPSYPDFLLRICIDNNITLIVPTIDTELLVLSDIKQVFHEVGISIVSCATEFVLSCRDKRRTAELFKSIDITYPTIYSQETLVFPAFCKPYDGSCSIGAKLLSSAEDLTADVIQNPKNIFMEYVGSDFKEYTCDAYFDKNSILKCLVPRERLEVRAGEVSKGVTRKNYVYEFLIDRLKKFSGAVGCVTLQVFGNPDTSEIKGLEINPRFGGGYPLTSASGCSYVELLIREYLLDEKISFVDDWINGLIMLRYDAKVIVFE